MMDLERLEQQYWGGRIIQAALAHLLAGFGLGLIAFPSVRDQARPLAYLALLASAAMHVYAFLNPAPAPERSFAERLGLWR
jgi:hypothetical protein